MRRHSRRQVLVSCAAIHLVLALAAADRAAAQTLTTLHYFSATTGVRPTGELIRGSDGNLWGTTTGLATLKGSAFRITLDGVLTVVYRFPLGVSPTGLVEGSDGSFYGTTTYGGTSGNGTVFRLTPTGELTTLHSFAGPDGRTPAAALALGSDGALYGNTKSGGPANDGTVFRVTAAGVLTTVHAFSGPDGQNPEGRLVEGSDGDFYGTTTDGGAHAKGTVFRITSAGVLTTLHSFAGLDGQLPRAELIQGRDGNFYGTTSMGGSSGGGTIFRMTPAGSLTTMHSFYGHHEPRAPLVEALDGNFYGTTMAGGAYGDGMVFRMTPSGAITTLYSFAGPDGWGPMGGLVETSDGHFYGTTNGGTAGAALWGTVFRLIVPRANLRVTAIKAPAAVAPGASFSVKVTTRNEGPGLADASTTALWRSRNKTVGDDEPLPGCEVGQLAAGGTDTCTVNTSVSDIGFSYLLAQADANGVVVETNEADNVKSKSLVVGPDLVATVALDPASPTSTTPTTITVTAKNVGGDTAGASVTRVYRSADARIDPGDEPLLPSCPVPALLPKGRHPCVVTTTLPRGTYYLIAQVDATGTVVEARETNNFKKVKQTVP